MANQMIALGARAPQSNPLGGAVQQGAQMVNMMRQQEAAQRQAAAQQQQMDLALAGEARAAAAAGRDAEKFALEKEALIYAKHRRRAPAVIESKSPQVYAAFVEDMKEDAPGDAALLLQAMPVENFDPAVFARIMATMDQQFEARHGKAITRDTTTPEGVVMGANISSIPGATFAVPVPDISQPVGKPASTTKGGQSAAPSGSAPAAAFSGSAAAPQNLKPVRGANTRPEDLLQQGQPISRIPLGNPLKPMSYTGETAQPDLGAVVQDMMQTGVISQSNFEAMRAAAGPQNDTKLAEILRANNIQIMPDEAPAGGMRSAVYRPEEGAAAMEEVQYNPNEYRPVRVKSPTQSPTPGVYNVPTNVVREKAKAERETPGEIYERTRSSKQAESDVEFLNDYAKNTETVRSSLNVLDQMIGDATIGKDGRIFIPEGGNAPHEGFANVVGFGVPGMRFLPGSKEADFDAKYKQVTGAAFLEAFDKLRGGGQITNTEGEKATAAISRLGRNISEVEFVRAVAELRDIMRRGLERAEARKAKLEGRPAPAQRPAKAPAAAGKRVIRSGMYRGRRVVEYSDGSVDYAD